MDSYKIVIIYMTVVAGFHLCGAQYQCTDRWGSIFGCKVCHKTCFPLHRKCYILIMNGLHLIGFWFFMRIASQLILFSQSVY